MGTSGLVVGLDIGTTAVKAVVADEAGNIVVRHRVPSKLIVGPTGRFEHDAVATWWEGPRTLLRETLDQLRASGQGEAQAVAVSAMMPSLAAVDASGRPVGPGLLYGDSRGQRPAQISDGHGGETGAGGGGDPTGDPLPTRLATRLPATKWHALPAGPPPTCQARPATGRRRRLPMHRSAEKA